MQIKQKAASESVLELKIWHGDRYNADGEKQLIGYLDYWNLNTGYMLSFNFNKKVPKLKSSEKTGKKPVFP